MFVKFDTVVIDMTGKGYQVIGSEIKVFKDKKEECTFSFKNRDSALKAFNFIFEAIIQGKPGIDLDKHFGDSQ